MIKSVWFLVLLLGHLLGDFIFQTPSLAKKKADNLFYVLLHGGIYALCMAGILLAAFPFSFALLYVGLLAALTHLAVDLVKFFLSRQKELANTHAAALFLGDQAAHLLILLALSLSLGDGALLLRAWPDPVAASLAFTTEELLKAVLLLLLAGKPANLLFLTLFRKFRPKKDGQEEVKNAGATIGTLERIVMMVMLCLEQYAAVGLVLTAKSIARYDRISKEPRFAEYYLLGTLTSLFYSVAAVFLLW